MSLLEARFNTIYSKYKRQNLEDSAYKRVQERLADLWEEAGYKGNIPKGSLHFRDRAPEGFNEELADIMRDFLNDEDRMISSKSSFYTSDSYKTFMQHSEDHPEVKTKQDYINYIEDIKHGKNSVIELILGDSDEVAKFYRNYRKKGLTTDQIDKAIENATEKNRGTDLDVIYEYLRADLNKKAKKLGRKRRR